MEWVELLVPAGPLVEEIAALLGETCAVAAAGVEVRGQTVVLWAPEDERDAAMLVLRDAVAHLSAEGLDVDPAAVYARPAAREAEWRDAWKKHFHVTRLARRIVIVPSWETFQPAPADVVLDLDPGRAFGTGAHASTRLCLEEIERLCDEDQLRVARFLDEGTGSGILSIAAAKLWPAATGVAIDIDPIAVGAARENLERNGVAARVTAGEDLAATEGRFELVVANIQADVLEGLRDALLARLAPGGALVLSGLLTPQAAAVAEHYVAAGTGLRLARVRTFAEEPDWSAAILRAA